jgi:LysR family transcriptional regulator for metE and metH
VTRIPAPPRPLLEIRDLRVVLALAATGSTTRATSVLHLTQPAVSRALLLAEEKMGVRLFDRSGRGLTPTPAGERLIAGAGPILSELEQLEKLASTPPAEPTRVRLVCECYTAYRWLPSTLVTLRRGLPGLEVALAVEPPRRPCQRSSPERSTWRSSPPHRSPMP